MSQLCKRSMIPSFQPRPARWRWSCQRGGQHGDQGGGTTSEPGSRADEARGDVDASSRAHRGRGIAAKDYAARRACRPARLVPGEEAPGRGGRVAKEREEGGAALRTRHARLHGETPSTPMAWALRLRPSRRCAARVERDAGSRSPRDRPRPGWRGAVIRPGETVEVYLCREPVDMRRSIPVWRPSWSRASASIPSRSGWSSSAADAATR